MLVIKPDQNVILALLHEAGNLETEGAIPVSLDEKLSLIFYMVKDTLDRDKDRYTAVCNKNKENAKLRWQKKQTIDS